MDRASVDHLAAFLAKRGVNLVRLHGTTYPGRGDLTARDESRIDSLQYFVAAMKKQGIYSSLSIYFPLWVRLDEEHGWEGYDDEIPFSLVMFDPKFQQIYRGWWRDLLTADNPHTGVPLAREPAIAYAELQNEDSFFFWTFTPGDKVPAEQMPALNAEFRDWLRAKGRPDEAAEVASVWMMAQQTEDPRAKDSAAFLTELQRGFYEDHKRFLRDELGYAGAVTTSNWVTASPRYLEPLEKHTYLAGDLTDRHGYYGGVVEGEGSNYSLRDGHVYADRAVVRFEAADPAERGDGPSFGMPLMNPTYADENGPRPATMSEFDHNAPNRFRSELPLIASAYSALQGMDGPMFFALDGPGWLLQETKWPLQGPETMGQFPAFSLVYRLGHVTPGPVAVEVTAGVDRLKRLGGMPTVGTVNLDALRAADVPDGEAAEVAGVESIDPRAFLVGQVRVNLMPGDGEPVVKTAGLARNIDESSKTITSATGELTWDHGRGLIALHAPAAKAAAGFLGEAGPIDLGDGVALDSPMEYGCVAVVALDDRPVGQSGLVLVQVMSEAQNLGYQTEPAGEGLKRIASLGGPPMIVREFAGTLSLPSPMTATPLDANLRPAGEAIAAGDRLELRPDVMYYLLRR